MNEREYAKEAARRDAFVAERTHHLLDAVDSDEAWVEYLAAVKVARAEYKAQA
jgi:hypothetical protein